MVTLRIQLSIGGVLAEECQHKYDYSYLCICFFCIKCLFCHAGLCVFQRAFFHLGSHEENWICDCVDIEAFFLQFGFLKLIRPGQVQLTNQPEIIELSSYSLKPNVLPYKHRSCIARESLSQTAGQEIEVDLVTLLLLQDRRHAGLALSPWHLHPVYYSRSVTKHLSDMDGGG